VLPTTGSATYNMTAATAVTGYNNETPGSVKSATLGVNFATNRVGFEALVGPAGGGADVAIKSTGGLAAPSGFLNTNARFNFVATNGSNYFGFLAGAGAGYAAVDLGNTVIAFTKGP
jgi:hypothetical protein